MAENNLIGGVNPLGGAQYPSFQPIQQVNPLAQMSQAAQVAGQLQGLQQQQFALGKQRVDYVHDQLGALLTKPDLSFNDATTVVGNLVSNGVMPKDKAAEVLSQLPQDPTQLRSAIQQHYVNTLDFRNRMSLGFGDTISHTDQGGIRYGVVNPQAPGSPQFTGGTSLAQRPDPSQLSDITTRGPSGAPVTTRLPNDVVMDIARGKKGYDASKGGAYDIGPNGQMAQRGAAPAATPGISSLPVGAAEAASKTAGISAGLAGELADAVKGQPARQTLLSNLESDMTKFDTGPLAGKSLAARRLFNDVKDRIPGGDLIPGFDRESISAHENFNKNASQLIQQQFTALGGTGTDRQLGSAISSNPNDALSKMGNRDIVAMLHGNEDALAAKNKAWLDYQKKNGAESYPQFQQDWNSKFSPRAFQFARMDPKLKADYFNSLTTPEKEALKHATAIGREEGWFKQ
jgi:hypothetical protein